jgi:hypothetical protein
MQMPLCGRGITNGYAVANPESSASEWHPKRELVRRGIWQPPSDTPVLEKPRECPSFQVFASEWLAKQTAEGGVTARTRAQVKGEDLEWRLSNDLLGRLRRNG